MFPFKPYGSHSLYEWYIQASLIKQGSTCEIRADHETAMRKKMEIQRDKGDPIAKIEGRASTTAIQTYSCNQIMTRVNGVKP